MKSLLSLTAVALTLGTFTATPTLAAIDGFGFVADIQADDVLERRGRGRGGDDDGGDNHGGRGDNDDDGSGSGRDRDRVPGGSGCDDPGDILEHPECAG